MSEDKNLSKEQLLKAIEKLEKNPTNKLNLADIGTGAIGAVGGGAAAAFFGASTVPRLFGLMVMPVAAPIGVVALGVALGAPALVGVKRVLFDRTFTEGKQAEMLRQLKEQLREVEAKERVSQLSDRDKNKFIISLKEPIRLNLISTKDAEKLIRAVENGRMSLKKAIRLVENIIKSNQVGA